MLGHSKMKTFTLPSTPPNRSFCAEPKAKSQNPSSKITLVLRERVDFEGGVGEGQTRTLN